MTERQKYRKERRGGEREGKRKKGREGERERKEEGIKEILYTKMSLN